VRSRRHLAHVASNLCELDKEGARGNFKGGFGYHPLGAWLDNTGEALAAVLRPGNAGSNTAADTSPSWTWRSPSCRTGGAANRS